MNRVEKSSARLLRTVVYVCANHFIAVIMIACILVSQVYAKYGGGSGTKDLPYRIETASQLNAIGTDSNDWGSHFLLIQDIDLSAYTGTSFNVIGNEQKAFSGVFDGNGRIISNFTYDSSGSENVAIFGYLNGVEAEIKNLGLIDPKVIVAGGVGCIVSLLEKGHVFNCYVTGADLAGWSVGGLIGSISDAGVVTDCYVKDSNIIAENAAGGLAALCNGQVQKCYVQAGSVTGNMWVGGLVGGGQVTINNCYSSTSVTGNIIVGGLIGMNNNGHIKHCYSIGHVQASSIDCGLVGLNSGTVTSSFWDKQTSTQSSSAGGTGLNTDLMQDPNTFITTGWDFVDETDNGQNDIWRLCDQGNEYPKLNSQLPAGDFGCPDGVGPNDLTDFTENWLIAGFSADTVPDGGDGTVNFLDYAYLAGQWNTKSGQSDLQILSQQWLQVGWRSSEVYRLDIAPKNRDWHINLMDYAVLADNWLKVF